MNPGVAVFGDPDTSGGNGLILYADEPNTSLTVRRDAASYAADHGMGAMIVHFHNTVGNKAQIVDLDHTPDGAKSGTGTGSVTSSPSGISCGATCSASFASWSLGDAHRHSGSDSTLHRLVGRRLLGHRHLSA